MDSRVDFNQVHIFRLFLFLWLLLEMVSQTSWLDAVNFASTIHVLLIRSWWFLFSVFLDCTICGNSFIKIKGLLHRTTNSCSLSSRLIFTTFDRIRLHLLFNFHHTFLHIKIFQGLLAVSRAPPLIQLHLMFVDHFECLLSIILLVVNAGL